MGHAGGLMVINDLKRQWGRKTESLTDAAKNLGNKAVTSANFLGDKAAVNARVGARAVSEKAQDGHHKMLLNHYNPLFLDEHLDPEFDLPKMIVVVDENKRKGIEVCEGAMGWLGEEAGLEILYLYEKAVTLSGLTFYPRPICDAVYFVDVFHADKYVNLESYFEGIQKDKMIELADVAHALGVKKYQVQSYEMDKSVAMKKFSANEKTSVTDSGRNASEELSDQSENAATFFTERHILFTQIFEGNALPVRP